MNSLRQISAALLLSLVSLTAVGCGGSDVTPSVSGTTPLRAFRGRTSDVLLSGSGTKWDSNAMVSFGDGVTVNKVTAASPTALMVNITVAATAALGPRDITVTQGGDASPYTMAFMIESPVEVRAQGSTAQGSIVFLTIENKDLEHLFDDTSEGGGLFSAPTYPNVTIKGPTGTSVNVSNVTPFRVEATMLIDANAAPSAFDLELKSGPKDAMQDSFVYPAVFQIAARTPEALTGSASFNVGQPFESKLYKLTPGGADHLVQLQVTGDGSDSKPSLVALEAPGTFKKIINSGDSLSWLATSADEVYVVVYDAGGTGGFTAQVKATDTALTVHAGEGDDAANNAFATPVALTLPTLVKGASLSSSTDVDWYKITVAAGDVGKQIHVQTFPGDASTDLTVRVYKGTDDSMPITKEIDNDAHENVLTPAVTAAGDYLIRIAPSSYFDPSASKYNLAVVLE